MGASNLRQGGLKCFLGALVIAAAPESRRLRNLGMAAPREIRRRLRRRALRRLGSAMSDEPPRPVWKSKFYDAFVLNHIVVLHAIDATPARWHGDADSSPLDGTSAATPSLRNDLVKNCRVHLTHWLISTQVPGFRAGFHNITFVLKGPPSSRFKLYTLLTC